MRTLLKVLLSIVALFVIVLIAIPFVVNPNDYKDEITAQVEKATGRQLTLEGDIGLSVFPWVALELGPTKLSNAKGFQPQDFATVKNVEVRLKLIPLLSEKIELSTIVLDGLTLNLQVDKKGKNNWTFTKAANTTAEAEQTNTTAKDNSEATTNSTSTPGLAAISIAGVKITNANISFTNAQNGTGYQVNNFNLNIDKFSPGEKTPLSLVMDVVSKKPDMQAHVTLNSDVIADIDAQQFAFNNLIFTTKATGGMIPSGTADIKLNSDIKADLKQQTVTISDLQLAIQDLLVKANIQANKVMSNPTFTGKLSVASFNPKKLASTMKIALPEMSDKKALTSIALSTDLSGTSDSVQAKQMVVTLDDSTLTGSLGVSHFSNPFLNFNLKLDGIDVDRYMPKAAKSTTTKSKTTAAKSGTTSKASSNSGSDKIPLEPLRQINAKGTFDIGKLKANNLTVQNLHLALDARNGLIKIPSLKGNLYQGSFNSSATIDARSNILKVALNKTIKNVHIGPLFKDLAIDAPITGTTNFTTALTLSGATVDGMKKTLSGKGNFDFTNGAIKGINIAESIRKAQAALKGKSYTSTAPEQTDFAELKGSFTANKGVISNSDLSMKSPLLRINGAGKVNLPAESLNYQVNTSIVGTATGQAGKDLADLTKFTIPVKITGTFSNPKPSVDLQSLLKQNASSELKDKANKQIDKLLGNGSSSDSAKKLLNGLF